MAKPRKIILAEHNEGDASLTQHALKKLNLPVDVVRVHHGQELLQLLHSESLDNIALIMMELDLPQVSGLDILKRFYLDEELRKLPTMIFTNSTNEADVLACYEHGVNAYVPKPVDAMKFEEAVSAIANFWADINVLPSYNSHPV